MSGTSTKTAASSEALSTFATLRFLGDRLEPDRIGSVLGAEPTAAYRKGEVYRRGPDYETRGRTGIWYLSTRLRVKSGRLADHLHYLVRIVCPERGADLIAALCELMATDELAAEVSCFWYGKAGADAPAIPAFAEDVFVKRLGATIELDFDTD